MPEIKAIETQYKGYLFRSRHEARWAVFFDALGLRWEYEPEGYDLAENGYYLPDFWLTDLNIWIEIKPVCTNGEGWLDDRHESFSENVGTLIVLRGTPGEVEPYNEMNPYEGWVIGDYSYYWCECRYCGAVGIQFDGRADRNKHLPNCNYGNGDKGYNMDSPRLLAAYAAAKSAFRTFRKK